MVDLLTRGTVADLWICSIYETVCSHCWVLSATLPRPFKRIDRSCWQCRLWRCGPKNLALWNAPDDDGQFECQPGTDAKRQRRRRRQLELTIERLHSLPSPADNWSEEKKREWGRVGERETNNWPSSVIRIFLTATWLHFNARQKINNKQIKKSNNNNDNDKNNNDKTANS